MHFRSLPVLSEEDSVLSDALGVGLKRREATILTYLLRRQESNSVHRGPATRLEIQVGTGLGRDAAISATNSLVESGLVETKSIEPADGGNPRKAWFPTAERESSLRRIWRKQALSLLDNCAQIGWPSAQTAVETLELETDDTVGGTEPLDLALNWMPNSVHVPFIIGKENDYYSQLGVDLTLKTHMGSDEAVRSLLDGQVDLSIAGSATLSRFLHRDDAIVPIGLLYQRTMVVMYTVGDRVEETFEPIETLRGQRIAMIPDSETGLVARLFLSQSDVLRDVTIVNTDGEEREAVLSGSADVATGIISDPLALEADGMAVESMLIGRNFPIPGLAIVTTPEILAHSGSLIQRFLAGTMAGWSEVLQSPAEATQTLERLGVEPPPGTVELLTEKFGMNETVRERGWGWQTETQWTRIRLAMEQTDLMEGVP